MAARQPYGAALDRGQRQLTLQLKIRETGGRGQGRHPHPAHGLSLGWDRHNAEGWPAEFKGM